jgi:hypothetical protein
MNSEGDNFSQAKMKEGRKNWDDGEEDGLPAVMTALL